MERSKIISWYQCAKVQSLCKSHSLVYTSKVYTSIIKYTLFQTSPSSTTCLVFIAYHYVRTELPFSHCCLRWSLITYDSTARQPHHALASKGNRRFMQTCVQTDWTICQCNPCKQNSHAERVPRDAWDTCASMPCAAGKTPAEKKRCICAYIYSSVRLASPREI